MSENEKNSEVMLPTGSELVLSSSPHLSSPDSVRRIMYKVLLALVPAAIAGVWFFGFYALVVMVVTMLFCVGAEALWCKLAGKPVMGTIADGSAAVTGLLLAMNLPPGVPLWVCLIGAFLAIWLGKQIFGGIGNNPFNPALVARVGLLIALPAIMTTWPVPRSFDSADPAAKITHATDTPVDSITGATPLGEVGTTKKILDKSEAAYANFQAVDNDAMLWKYFLGEKGGCIGETSVLALLIGGILLIALKLINWRVPVCYIGTVAIITGLVHFFYPGVSPSPLFHILTGGLMMLFNPFITLLFGGKYCFSMTTVMVIVAEFYITRMRQTNLLFREAMGLFWNDRYKAVAESIINLVASLVLVRQYGVTGIIWGTIISTLCTCAWVEPYIFLKYGVQDAWQKKLRDYFAEYLKRTLLTAAVSAAAVLWVQRFPVGNFGIFILDGLLYTAVFAGVIVLFYRGSEEYDTLRQRGLKILKRRAE